MIRGPAEVTDGYPRHRIFSTPSKAICTEAPKAEALGASSVRWSKLLLHAGLDPTEDRTGRGPEGIDRPARNSLDLTGAPQRVALQARVSSSPVSTS